MLRAIGRGGHALRSTSRGVLPATCDNLVAKIRLIASLCCLDSLRHSTSSENKRLNRSEFMPFAPYVLEEDAERVFEITPINRYAARFMTITCAVRSEWRSRIPAVVHVDNTARPQIIRDADNPMFAAILREFRARTGVPVLINTSFNVHEEPIINRPEECGRALIDGRVDFVVTKFAAYVPAHSTATQSERRRLAAEA